jgi:hypothetical protein
MFQAVDEVVGDGALEVPVPDMSRETIYDDEPKTEKEVEAHKECGDSYFLFLQEQIKDIIIKGNLEGNSAADRDVGGCAA